MVNDGSNEAESGRLSHLFQSAEAAEEVATRTGGEVLQGPEF